MQFAFSAEIIVVIIMTWTILESTEMGSLDSRTFAPKET